MKIRHGFVSNSSSSSFCLLGIKMNEDTQKKLRNYSNSIRPLVVEDAISEWDDNMFLGMWPCDMKDNQTLLQFKEQIVSKMKEMEISVSIKDLKWYEDGGYNG